MEIKDIHTYYQKMNKSKYVREKESTLNLALIKGDLNTARAAVKSVRNMGWELDARRLEAKLKFV